MDYHIWRSHAVIPTCYTWRGASVAQSCFVLWLKLPTTMTNQAVLIEISMKVKYTLCVSREVNVM